MRKTKTTVLALASLISILALWSPIKNSDDSDRPDPAFLSTDLYFRLNKHVISVPVVAVQDIAVSPNTTNPLPRFRSSGVFGSPRWFATRDYKSALLERATDPGRPAEVTSVDLNFGYYGSYGESRISQEICPKLSKDWSRMACANQLRNVLNNFPEYITLSTGSGLARFRSHSFSGVPDLSVFNLLETMAPISRTAKMACAKGERFCYAAISVSEGLYAVWSPSCSNIMSLPCQNELAAQGAEIQNFVRNELLVL